MSARRLEARGLSFAYGRHPVLHGVDLTVEPGQLVGLIGPNGSGKTTLLHVLAGLLRPAAGRITLGDRPLSSFDARQRAAHLALVPQHPSVAFGFTALEVVLLGRAARGGGWLDRPEDVEAARAALRAVEAEELAPRPVDALSGGERQRVFIARALAQGTGVLLLDEPTNHLDLHHQLAVWARLEARVKAEGLAAAAVLHDLNLATQFCDRLVVLAGGRIEASGAPAEVLASGVVERVYGVRLAITPHPRDGRPTVAALRD